MQVHSLTVMSSRLVVDKDLLTAWIWMATTTT
jgi:hypothetical protein